MICVGYECDERLDEDPVAGEVGVVSGFQSEYLSR